MTTGVIELNDSGIRLGIDGEIRSVSPGIAVINGDELLLGDQAAQISRLHPVDTNNQFWHRLSVEPLNKTYKHLRHHADLAYQQLISLHQQHAEIDDVIFAVSGNFTRDQLSLLLGIVQECPFNTVGLVDNAVAASVAIADTGEWLHIDIQLHQCLLTSLNADGVVQRQAVSMIPESGQLALYSKIAQFIADQFVGQSRFDPLHSAATDQQLYNQIPAWLRQCEDQEELVFVVGNKTIKLARDQLVASLQPIYEKISQQAQQLFSSCSQFIVSDRLSAFPGMKNQLETLGILRTLSSTATIKNTHRLSDHIVSNTGEISFLQSLPLINNASFRSTPTGQSTSEPPPTSPLPATDTENNAGQIPNGSTAMATHALLKNTACRLGESELFIEGKLIDGQQHLSFNLSQTLTALCAVRIAGADILLTPISNGIRINHHPVSENTHLHAGDTIHFDGTGDFVTMISEQVIGA